MKKYLENIDALSVILKITKPKYIPFLTLAPFEILIDNNPGILVDYYYTEDHCLKIQIYEKAESVASISLAWEGSQITQKELVNIECDSLAQHNIFNNAEACNRFINCCEHYSLENPYGIANELGLKSFEWTSCDELENLTMSQFKEIRNNGIVIDRHQVFSNPTIKSNQWCHLEDQPSYMYLPLPKIELNQKQSIVFQKHIEYWAAWDKRSGVVNNLTEHYRVYEFYRRYLPIRFKYLCDRIIQCSVLMDKSDYESWKSSQEETIRSIIGLIGKIDDILNKLNLIVEVSEI